VIAQVVSYSHLEATGILLVLAGAVLVVGGLRG
jgi:hypothetical protein